MIVRSRPSLASVVRAPYAIGAAFTIALFALFAFRSPIDRSTYHRESGVFESIRRRVIPALRSRSTWVLVVLISLHGAADTAIYQWFPSYLTHRFADLTIGPGVTLTLYSLAYVLSRVLLLLIPDEYGRRAFIVLPGLLGGALMIAALLVASSGPASILYAVAAFCWSFEFPAVLSEAYRKLPGAIGSLQSVAFIVSAGMQILLIGAIGVGFERGMELGKLLIPVALMFPLFSLIAQIGGVGSHEKGGGRSDSA